MTKTNFSPGTRRRYVHDDYFWVVAGNSWPLMNDVGNPSPRRVAVPQSRSAPAGSPRSGGASPGHTAFASLAASGRMRYNDPMRPQTETPMRKRCYRPTGGGKFAATCQVRCIVAAGQRGACGVRANIGGTLIALVNGLASSLRRPIEKKPLYHFYPGTQVLSVGTGATSLPRMSELPPRAKHPQSGATLRPLTPEQSVRLARRTAARNLLDLQRADHLVRADAGDRGGEGRTTLYRLRHEWVYHSRSTDTIGPYWMRFGWTSSFRAQRIGASRDRALRGHPGSDGARATEVGNACGG